MSAAYTLFSSIIAIFFRHTTSVNPLYLLLLARGWLTVALRNTHTNLIVGRLTDLSMSYIIVHATKI